MTFDSMTVSNYGTNRTYVVTEDDIENGGSVDGDGFQFEDKEDAERTMERLCNYAKEKGYVNLKFFIDDLEIENEEDDENLSIRKMYEDFETLQHNAFYELYSEEDWDYCNTHTLEQAIEENYQPSL